MKIVKLDVREDSELEGIDAVALVENPAIEIDFQAFSSHQFQSFDDYPQAARDAAAQGIKRNEALGNKCGTQVGKVRAQQLAQGKPVSLDTIKRMRAFLIRQKDNYDLAIRRKDYDACGYISYLLWGGPAALPWAEKKLRQAGILEQSNFEIIRDEFAEIGPRGGIKESPKAPKSDTPNPDPKGQGTARGDASTTRGAKVDKQTEETLKQKSDDFNERYKDKLGYGTNIGMLKAVYQRGLGAYNTSRSPEVAKAGGAKQWALARVNAFLYLMKEGRPQNKKYTTDYDLLPKDHPKSEKMSANGVKNPYIAEYDFSDIKMIEGVPVFQDENDALQVAEMIGCGLNTHQHEVGGSLYYMPCSTHQEAIDKLKNQPNKFFDELDDDKQELLLKALDNVGLTEDSLAADGWVEISEDAFHNHLYFAIVSQPDRGSLQDTNQYKVLYEYSQTPRDSKNRSFCRRLIDLKGKDGKPLKFRIEDINNMSLSGENEEFGTYDIFAYKGSYNCRHRWIQKFYRKEKPVEEQSRSVKNLLGPFNVIGGPRAQEAAQTNPKSRTQAEVEAGVPAGEFQFSAVKGEEQVLVGPLMIPDKLIPRLDENGQRYYVFFDTEGIKKLSYKMIINKLIDSVNIEHDPNQKVKDATLVESWLIEDPKYDKSVLYGYNLPKGSWMAKYKINNKSVWDDYIKTGRVKGFSVEGIFNDKIIMASNEQ